MPSLDVELFKASVEGSGGGGSAAGGAGGAQENQGIVIVRLKDQVIAPRYPGYYFPPQFAAHYPVPGHGHPTPPPPPGVQGPPAPPPGVPTHPPPGVPAP